MNLEISFQQLIKKKWPQLPGTSLLLAVSGGLDSVVLAELCFRCGLDMEMAHVNFQLRGEESEQDEGFVRELAGRYGKKLHVRKTDTRRYAEEHKLSVQVAARELRYAWFDELIGARPALLLTAHHADDNVETILMNFFKGTGIAGLRGIQEEQGHIIRPLLSFRKEELHAFAVENHLNWREDSSNAEEKYTRNYFRHSIIPMVEKVFPAAAENLLDNIERFRDIELLYRQSVQWHKKRLVEKKGGEWHIPVLKLKQSIPLSTLLWEITREFGFQSGQLPDILALLDSQSGKQVQSSSHRIIRNRKWLVIAPLVTHDDNPVYCEEGMEEIFFGHHKLHISFRQPGLQSVSTDPAVATLDAKHFRFPLIIRKWKAGDYFYPLGMKKKKKLSRFFIDQKLSRTQKEQVWVIESDKKICWVVGLRIDDRFRITSASKNIMELRLISSAGTA